MKRAIVTGGTGFIGANLLPRLLHDGHEVHLLIRRGCDFRRIERKLRNVRLHEIDFCDEETISCVVAEIRPQLIFHLATHNAYSMESDRLQMVKTNIQGTVNLVEACLKTGFEAFVNAGSSSEYGLKNHPPPEADSLDPNSYYAVTKASATMYCRYTARKYRMNLTTLRLYSVYGPFEEETRLIPSLVRFGLQGNLPPLVNPDVVRDFVFVGDVVDAFITVATTPRQDLGQIYNVGTGVQTSIREVVEVAKRVMNIPDQPKWGSMLNRHWDTKTWVADTRLIQNKLGWRARHTFEDGFKRTVEWFKNQNSTRE